MQTSSVMWDTTVYNTSFFLLASFPSAEYLYSLSVFLPWEQRACLVCVEWGCWEYGKGTQCVAQVCLILLSKERLEGWGTSLLVLSLPLSLFFLSPSKKGTGCWMLTYHNVGQSTHKKKKKRRRMGEWEEEGWANTVRQQKLIEQKKTLERRVHGSG